MRLVTLLSCLALAACSGGGFKDDPAAAEAAGLPAAAALAAPAPSATAARPRPAPAAAGGGSSAGGGARTAAARAPSEPADPGTLTQARVECWMKVESQRGIRDIDRRIAFVDKCVTDVMKGY
jgi:hypothetical protein